MSARNFEIEGTRAQFGTVGVFQTIEDGVAYTNVQLHATIVVKRQNINNICTLNSGGWKTMTTKAVMNRALRLIFKSNDVSVDQRKHIWYVSIKGMQAVPYFDGIMVGGDSVNGYMILNPKEAKHG